MPGASDISGIARQALGSVGRLTSWVGSAVGAITTLFFILVLGLFFAMEPRVYERGVQWMIPRDSRAEFALTLRPDGLHAAPAARRASCSAWWPKGVLTWVALALGGVPLAALLGIITGILAFIPNIGAFISGVLMVAVGFSAGMDTGLWAIGTYIVVQTFDGYVLLPIVAKKTVDMPPALTLGAQILASAILGLIGLALADSFVAMMQGRAGAAGGAGGRRRAGRRRPVRLTRQQRRPTASSRCRTRPACRGWHRPAGRTARDSGPPSPRRRSGYGVGRAWPRRPASAAAPRPAPPRSSRATIVPSAGDATISATAGAANRSRPPACRPTAPRAARRARPRNRTSAPARPRAPSAASGSATWPGRCSRSRDAERRRLRASGRARSGPSPRMTTRRAGQRGHRGDQPVPALLRAPAGRRRG